MLLQVDNLHTHLNCPSGLVKAVDGVSFAIEKGETFCLVGESGSGKSICALSILQLLPEALAFHPEGRVQLTGNETAPSVEMLSSTHSDLDRVRGNRIAMIFQEPMTSLNPVFTIGDQLIEAIQITCPELNLEKAREKAIAALESVQISKPNDRIDHYPHQLSGGQRQRVMIAMALACEPDLLIADEPTTALDVTVQAEIITLMKNLQQQTGMGILFITHDLALVSQIADKIAIMKAGKIVEQGNCNTILTEQKHAYTRELLAALPENLPPITTDHPNQTFDGQTQRISTTGALINLQKMQVFFPIKKGLFRQTVDYIRAVDDVDLTILKGDIFALVGESGSGKTTLGRAILRLIEPTAGEIYYQQHPLSKLNRKAMLPFRKRMQIIFQDPASSLNPRMMIETALTEPMAVHGIGASHDERVALAQQLLDDVYMPANSLWRYPHEFSGGQRQRIGIARALSINPDFIVCDEVTSALDVSVQAEILQMLAELRANRNLTLLFISHDISVVEYISNKIAVMKHGKIVEQGSVSQICNKPQHAYTSQLLEAVPRLSF